MTNYVLIVQLEIPHNLFRPSAQIRQLFGIFKKITLITCPLSLGKGISIKKSEQPWVARLSKFREKIWENSQMKPSKWQAFEVLFSEICRGNLQYVVIK